MLTFRVQQENEAVKTWVYNPGPAGRMWPARFYWAATATFFNIVYSIKIAQ
jgi:hypothetical protein